MKTRRTLLLLLLMAFFSANGIAQTHSSKAITADSTAQIPTHATVGKLPLPEAHFGVAPFGDTLFYINNRIGSFSAKERAEAVSKRIKSLYEAPFFEPDSMTIVDSESGTDLIYSPDLIIRSISVLDTIGTGKSRMQQAETELNLIKQSILNEREKNSLLSFTKRIGWILLILVIMGLVIHLTNIIFRRLKHLLTGKIQHLHQYIRFFHFQLFDRNTFEVIVFRIVGFLRIFIILVVLLTAFSLLFSMLPVTRTWTVTLVGWILVPLKAVITDIWLYLPKLFSIVVIYLIFKYLILLLKYFFTKISDKTLTFDGFHSDWAQPTFSIIRFLLYAFMLVLIFPKLPGSESEAFKGVSVFLGVLISLGSSSVIGNVLAGLVITYMRPFKIGDRIKIGDITGDVLEKTALVTRIRTVKNEDITVPNSTILSGSTINYSANAGNAGNGLIVHTTITIGYDVPWREVHKNLLAAAARTTLILKEPLPFVLQTSLNDFSVSYQLNGYTRAAERQATLYSELHQHIQDCFNEAGIEIMSPQYSALRDGNASTIPADHLPEGYRPPTFKVN